MIRSGVPAFVLLVLSSAIGSLISAQPRPPTLTGKVKDSAPTMTSTQDSSRIPSDDDVVRIDTNLVTVPVSVSDRNGRYLADLKKDEFHILEDGIPQEIAFFAPVDSPFTILFLIDTSPSVSNRLPELAYAANEFVKELRPEDQLIALSFCESVTVLCDLTKVGNLRNGKSLGLRVCPHTLIYDAASEAFKRIRKVPSRRKAIVLFSDGYGSGIFASAKSNLRIAEELDALIYTVQYDTLSDKLPYDLNKKTYLARVQEGNHYMRALAQKTGGRYFQAESVSDWPRTFSLVANELRRQYTLGYYPKSLKANERREIKVKVDRLGAVVQARNELVFANNRSGAK